MKMEQGPARSEDAKTSPPPQGQTVLKSAQWLAVLLLALMVGGISFVKVYLGGRGSGGEGNFVVETPPSLTFPVKVVPQPGEKVLTTEVRQSGHYDFWFANTSGQDLAVGLNEKGCTCSEVELALAPPSWHKHLLVIAGQEPLGRGWSGLTLMAAARQQLEEDAGDGEAGQAMVLTKENSMVVPNGAIGRVRLSWRQNEVKPLRTFADVWMGNRAGANARLEAAVRIAAPLEVSKDFSIPAVDTRDLEKSQRGLRSWIVCWSLTRSSFDLKAEMLRSRLTEDSDAVQVGQPVPFNAADYARIEKLESMQMMTARSGYKIPVYVQAKAKDGTPIEWGFFSRLVQLSSSDPTIEPVQVTVTGEVNGDVSIGSGKEAGAINLGSFFRKSGTQREVVLQTDNRAIDLVLDDAHRLDYLRPSLSKAQETSSGHRLWKLRVEVPPGTADGDFPRRDNPDYRDSAIYVKTVDRKSGKPLRSIRIPVRGVANAG
jgi:hypothetical protein